MKSGCLSALPERHLRQQRRHGIRHKFFAYVLRDDEVQQKQQRPTDRAGEGMNGSAQLGTENYALSSTKSKAKANRLTCDLRFPLSFGEAMGSPTKPY